MQAYVHPSHGFQLSVPDGWRLLDGVEGVALAVVRTEPHPVFQPNVTVTVETHDLVDRGEAWVDEEIRHLSQALTTFFLVDKAPDRIGDIEGWRLVANHDHDRVLVTIETWLVASAATGYVLTSSMWGLDFGWQREIIRGIVDQFVPRGGA